MIPTRRPRVLMIFTGGTISMRFDPAAGGPVPAMTGEQILSQVRGIQETTDIGVVDFARLPGPHMTPARMWELAGAARAGVRDPDTDGVVITHGTDTLEESAYLLHLVMDTDKPVVFVGAMRNSSELSWDGPANLLAATRVAADPGACGLGVLVVMANQVFAAADATKTDPEALDTFQGRDTGPLGAVDKDRVIWWHRPFARDQVTTQRLEERVEIIKLSAGSDGRLLRLAIEDGARGLVVECLGRGNVPITALEQVLWAIRSDIPIVLTSRCPRGRVLDTYAYEGAGRELRRAGAILGGSLPSHKARIKLMLLLGAENSVEQIRTAFESEVVSS
ncbi:MAG: asparaginase [Pedosphaera sp.]|nr:asparaginase [Pedosphaera sp.]